MNRSESPLIKQAVDYDLHLRPYEYYELANGVPVYTISGGSQDVVKLELVFFSGNFYETHTGIASAANALMSNGTKSHTAFQISEAFDYYGAYFNRGCFSETAVLSLHGLCKHLTKVLPIIREVITEATYPEEELNIFRQNAKQRLIVNLKKGEFVAERKIDEMLFGKEHPYGRNTNIEDLDNLTVEDIRKFYSQYYQNGQCAIFAGGLLPANFCTLLNGAFGDLTLKRPDFVIPELPISPSVERVSRIENDSTSVQGAIRIASPFPNRHHPDFKAASVLNTLFGGFFGSRLMGNIREDKGYTYGIYSYLKSNMNQNAWVISTEAGRDVCDATVSEVYKEMARLCDELVDEEELMLVKNYLMGSVLGTLDGPFQIIGRWKNIILNNLDESYFYDSIKVIKSITPSELRDLAQKYLKPDRFYELVVY